MRTSTTRFALILLAACVFAGSGCKKGPCSGGGSTKDDRKLPDPWAELAPPPDGAVACANEDAGMRSEWARNYELGDSPKAGYTAFYDQLKAKGWKRLEHKTDERYEAMFTHSGHKLRLFASSKIEDKGWLTVEFTPAKKPEQGKK